jgi:tRNA U34 5-carboxymethylaminomethyl modifying GTPase MnmE/TrmE
VVAQAAAVVAQAAAVVEQAVAVVRQWSGTHVIEKIRERVCQMIREREDCTSSIQTLCF